MTLYGNYIKERLNHHIIETDKAFATYSFESEGVYVHDIYTHSDYRHEHLATKLADQIAEIAKQKGIHKMFGSVVPSANHSTESLKVLLAYGFRLRSST